MEKNEVGLFEQVRELLHAIVEAVRYFRQQDLHMGYQRAKKVNRLLQEMLEQLELLGLEEQLVQFVPVLQETLAATEEQDGIRIADVYEEGIVPFLHRLQSDLFQCMENPLIDYWGRNRRLLRERAAGLYRSILEAREDVPDCYQLNWAKTGDISLKKQMGSREVQVCSGFDPWKEAFHFTDRLYTRDHREYLCIGFGMGYHVEALLTLPGVQKVYVLENDIYQLAIAFSYRDFTGLLTGGKVELLYCPDSREYSRMLTEKGGDKQYGIWYPSVQTVEDRELRERLEDFWLELSSTGHMQQILERNFEANLALQDPEISALREQFQGKRMILAAAGPSLDENIEALSKCRREDCIFVCVGKVAKRLLEQGIRPDYIVTSDGEARTRWHIRGIETCGIPLCYLSTAAANVVREYQGKRYIAFQEYFEAAEEYARSRGYALVQSGGSVATFALDLGIRLGCRQIICVGLDLGYLSDSTHVKGIGVKIADREKLRKVEGISSEYVYTNKAMDIYRKWIEKRIAQAPEAEFINASAGARIHGMKEQKLSECIS